MKELKKEFIGRGQVKGFRFTQLNKSQFAYLYEVNTNDNIFYEVFYRKENKRYECVSYPTNKSFGIWAWTYSNLETASNKYEELNINRLNKIQ